ncbi:MAG: copper amine oxidase N-terminal domain-containing protein [Desulfotomaculales bacterium]
MHGGVLWYVQIPPGINGFIPGCTASCPFFPVGARAGDPVKLFVNGREVAEDIPPQLINGRTMVPVRWVAEALGAWVRTSRASSRKRSSSGRDMRRCGSWRRPCRRRPASS